MFLAISSNMAEAVECYICSWNPSDYNNGGGGGNNQHDYTDVCSSGHFDPERVRTHDCNKGCEIVSMRNPNGALEMYYRNCVTNQQITNAFIKKSSKLNDEEVYTCDYDLCNTADTGRHLHLFVLIISMIVLPIHSLFV